MSDRQIHPAFAGDMAANYDARNEPMAPLRDALHLLAGRLLLQDLAETVEILCVGAGTGKEVLHLASLAPGWRLTALDPSADMLAVCKREVEAAGIADRVRLFEGYVDELDDGIAYDAAHLHPRFPFHHRPDRTSGLFHRHRRTPALRRHPDQCRSCRRPAGRDLRCAGACLAVHTALGRPGR